MNKTLCISIPFLIMSVLFGLIFLNSYLMQKKIDTPFYHDYSILKEEDENVKVFRLELSRTVAGVIKRAFSLLGIEVPERM